MLFSTVPLVRNTFGFQYKYSKFSGFTKHDLLEKFIIGNLSLFQTFSALKFSLIFHTRNDTLQKCNERSIRLIRVDSSGLCR